MLSDSAKQELRVELGRLAKQREQIDLQIAAIHALLSTERPASPSPGENGHTFASKVRLALTELGHPATAGEVCEILESQGVDVDGTTPLKSVVSGELFRMAQRKTAGVFRKSRGMYSIKK